MDIYVQNCHQCGKRTPVASMVPILGKRYCEGCGLELAKLVKTQNREMRMGTIRCAPHGAPKKPKGMVKRWDAEQGEWRWVSKKTKPPLKPKDAP